MSKPDTGSKNTQPDVPETVVIGALQGNQAALTTIYDAYARRIYRYIHSRVGNVADAEDLTSQTFLGVLEALPRYQHRGQFTAWIFQIARFKAMDHFRRCHDISTITEALTDPQAGPLLEDIIRDQEIEKLAELFHALDEDERELLRLRYVAELSFVEIAALLGRKEDAVRKSLQRILARLYDQMEVQNA
ncbi:MAG: sigma-70 family RNA polymerase sigma factor [Chloroflexota bacterium]